MVEFILRREKKVWTLTSLLNPKPKFWLFITVYLIKSKTMNNSSIHQPDIDVIALESRHQSDFKRSRLQQKFSKNYQEFRTSFVDSKYDGELDLEPEPYQWFNPVYRKGYFAGITVRFNELFSA